MSWGNQAQGDTSLRKAHRSPWCQRVNLDWPVVPDQVEKDQQSHCTPNPPGRAEPLQNHLIIDVTITQCQPQLRPGLPPSGLPVGAPVASIEAAGCWRAAGKASASDCARAVATAFAPLPWLEIQAISGGQLGGVAGDAADPLPEAGQFVGHGSELRSELSDLLLLSQDQRSDGS